MIGSIIISLVLFVGFDYVGAKIRDGFEDIGEELKYIKYRIEKKGD